MTWIIASLVFLSTPSSQAALPPWIGICHQYKGKYVAAFGECHIGEAVINAATMFRGIDTKQDAIEAYFRRADKKYPKPKSVSPREFCKAVGGSYSTEKDKATDTHSPTCEFSDGSSIDPGTLMNGFDYPANQDLTKVLQSKEPLDFKFIDDGFRPSPKQKPRKGSK